VEGAALGRVCKMKNTFIMVEGASFLEDSHVDKIKRGAPCDRTPVPACKFHDEHSV